MAAIVAAAATIGTGAATVPASASVARPSVIPQAQWHRASTCRAQGTQPTCFINVSINRVHKIRLHADGTVNGPVSISWTAKCGKTGGRTRTRSGGWVASFGQTARTIRHPHEDSDHRCRISFEAQESTQQSQAKLNGWITFTRISGS